jgi:hypothetical protein
MCDICQRAILLSDLYVAPNGLTVCRSTRWCLIARLHRATDAQIARMHAMALQATLRSTESMELVAS